MLLFLTLTVVRFAFFQAVFGLSMDPNDSNEDSESVSMSAKVRSPILVVQEIGSGKVLQEIKIEKPILDICAFVLNTTQMVCVLTENELHVYKW